MIKFGFLVFFISFYHVVLAATHSIEKSLSLSEIIKQGLNYSPELKSSESLVRESNKTFEKTNGLIFPTINLYGTTLTKENSLTSQSTTSSTSRTDRFSDLYALGLNFTQPLYTGGAISNGLNYYEIQEESAKVNYYSVKQSRVEILVKAFFKLGQAQKNLEISVQNKDFMKSYIELTRSYEEIGRARKMDKEQAEANYFLVLSDHLSSQDILSQAQTELNSLLGRSRESSIIINTDELVTEKRDFSEEPFNKKKLENAEAESVEIENSIQKNPEIRLMELKMKAISYQKGMDLAVDSPSLNLVATAGYQSAFEEKLFNSQSQTYSVGLNLTIPLFSGLTSVAKRQIYAEQKIQIEKNMESEKDQLKSEIQKNLNTLKSLKERMSLARSAAQSSHSALELASKGYRQSLATAQDVINFLKVQLESDKQLVSLEYQYSIELLNLRKSLGFDLEKIYSNSK